MKKSTLFKIILPVVIIVAGILVFKMMAAHKQPPAHKTVSQSGTPVQVMVVEKGDRQVDVAVTGIIVPKREISVIPQVSGKVVYVAPSFQAGTYFPEGTVLLGIEDIDYTLAIERAKAQVAKMEFELTSVLAKADVAKGEWQRSHPGGPAPANSLVLYVPQLKDAAANLKSAKAALRQAEVNLSRTKITAPFNCRVRSEQVGVGQYLTPGSKAAVLVGSDEVEAIVPVPLADLAWLRVPGRISTKNGSKAAVRPGSYAIVQIHSAGQVFSWPGRLTRSLGEVDRIGKMTRLAVTVTDPYNLQLKSPSNRPELALGMFVQVILKGRTAAEVIAVPRQALRENDTLWLMTSENKLKIIQVDISRREQNEILITGGLLSGDRVVLSKIVGAIEGMSLKLETGEQAR